MTWRPPNGRVLALAALLGSVVGPTPIAFPQPQPPTEAAAAAPTVDPAPLDPSRQRQIEAAIENLSSADPAVREDASRSLWLAGEDASAALAEAAAGEDVEVARRAGEVLRNIRFGIRPDTPKAVTDLLALYRQGDRGSAQSAITGLGSRGTEGVRVLGRLWQHERDLWKRALLAQKLAERARATTPLLLAEAAAGPAPAGRAADAVLPLLEAAADAATGQGEQSMRDLAAFLLLRGGDALDQRIARLKPVVVDPAGRDAGAGAPGEAADDAPGDAAAEEPDAGETAARRARNGMLLAYLCRARSDLTAARWAAEQAGDLAAEAALLVELGEWKELARRKGEAAAASAATAPDLEAIGFAAAFCRMAGDADGAGKWTEQIAAYADRRPDDNWLAAEALFLNDRPDEGIAVLLKHRNHAAAASLLARRMQFRELFDLETAAKADKPAAAAQVEARVAAARHLLGDRKAARETLDRLIARNEQDRDFELYVALAESATAMREPALAEECAIQALTTARPMDDLASLFEQAGLGTGETAARWWALLRMKYREPVRITFGRLASLLRGGLPAAQMESLARAAAEEAVRAPTSGRDEWLVEIGQTLLSAGHRDAAKAYFRRLNGAPARAAAVPMAFVRLGDLEAEDGRWDEAATLYGHAWEMDKARPLPLLLRGHALTRIGRQREGRDLVELAHLMPLGDEALRHEVMVELGKRKLAADARRERDAILRTAAFASWHLGDALRRAGDEAYEKGEYAAAADLWDRAFLDNQSKATRFAEPWANFAMPSLIHRARALGLMRAGDFSAAAAEAELAMRYTPGDADAVIAVVGELENLGHKAEADDFFRRHTAPYRQLCRDYPGSGQAHNQLAWAQAKCRRELDEALKNATRAVELEPDNAASIDTLAESHFQRGEVQKAIEAIQKCIELEPKEKHHQEQLERFNKALREGEGRK